MLNLLVASTAPDRLLQLSRAVADPGSHRVTRAASSAADLELRSEGLNAFDVLLLESVQPEPDTLAALERLVRRHPNLVCMLVTPDATPATLLAAMRSGVRDVLGWPPEPRALSDALERAAAQAGPRSASDTRVMSLLSPRGGAGTSVIAANLAFEIAAASHRRTLLIDLNPLFADAAFLVSDTTPPTTIAQLTSQLDRLDGAFVDASVARITDTFHVLAGAGDPVSAGTLREDGLEWLLGIVMPRYDFVIFDLGVSLTSLTTIALDRSERVGMVLQPSMPHVRAGRHLLELLGSLGYPREALQLVLNRVTRANERTRAVLEEVLLMRAAQAIPDDPAALGAAIEQGQPISRVAPGSAAARALQAWAASLVDDARGTSRASRADVPLLARLFGRPAAPKLKSM